ncbi:unnamed protein product [Echinostoma caproni]|uniref:Solute carrier family 40 protein n=1 Tax=Echinostoma caproni TaxID=27848 RepID=A0A183A5J5_9TREM|nr:unnamed protein product [Echinostoma caproni]
MFYCTLPPVKSSQISSSVGSNRLSNLFGAWFQHILKQPWQLILIGFVSFALAWLFSWFLQEILGFDVNWSVALAQKACRCSEWVHLSTSLMVGFARIAGYLCGLALALQLNPPWTKSISDAYLSIAVVFTAIVAFYGTKVSESICRMAVESWASSTSHSTPANAPSSTLLLSSVFEASMGPLVAVWFIPYFINVRASPKM